MKISKLVLGVAVIVLSGCSTKVVAATQQEQDRVVEELANKQERVIADESQACVVRGTVELVGINNLVSWDSMSTGKSSDIIDYLSPLFYPNEEFQLSYAVIYDGCVDLAKDTYGTGLPGSAYDCVRNEIDGNDSEFLKAWGRSKMLTQEYDRNPAVRAYLKIVEKYSDKCGIDDSYVKSNSSS